jgi:hypothetical protein
MQSSAAETLALKALAHIATEPDVLSRFLASSGLEPKDLRSRVTDPELLAAVVDFVLSEDALTQSFTAAEGLDATALHLARRALPGGATEPA